MATLYLRLSLHPPLHPRPHHSHLLSHPLKTQVQFSAPNPQLKKLNLNPTRRVSVSVSVSASYNPTPAVERLISAAAYFLPFFNGLQYGRFLFAKYPSLAVPFAPILPLLSLYRSLPYASFVSFFALYLGVVRNPNLSRYVRFNALQAVVLDVLLVVPLLLQRIFSPGPAGLGFKLMVWTHNAIFVFIVCCFVYSLVCTILGKTPYLPLVADAAGRQL